MWRRVLIAWLVFAGCSSGSGGAPAAPAPPPPLKLWDRPAELIDPPAMAEAAGALGTWTTQVDLTGGTPDHGALGSYGLGNGRAFTQIGTAIPLSTWHGMAGPTYDRDGVLGFFSDVRLRIERDGARVPGYAHEGIWRLREAAVAATAAEGDGIRVETLDFAPREPADPDAARAILRRVRVVNTAASAAPFAVIVNQAGFDGARDGGIVESRPDRRRWCGALDGSSRARGSSDAVLELGTLEAGESTAVDVLCALGADDSEVDAAREAARAAGFDALLASTLDAWRAWFSGAARIETPDARVNDLLDGLLISIGVQVAHTGAVTEMSQYTRAWLRDQPGPVRYYADRGLHEEATRMLAYLYEASVRGGGVLNSSEADLEGPLPPEPDWDALPPGSGRTAAEGPSHLPILHRDLYRWTGDADEATREKGFLRYCLTSQEVSPEGLQTFSGDETYRQAMSFALDVIAEDFPAVIEFPYDGGAWSMEAGVLFAAAADSFHELMDAAGEAAFAAPTDALGALVRAKTDAYYPQAEGWYAPFVVKDGETPAPGPFEDVNTQLLWTGYLPPEDPRAVANLAATSDRLLRDDGLLLSPVGPRWLDLLGLPAGSSLYTGMAPGYGLWNLAAAGHPLAEAAFNALGVAADPGGNYGEYQYLIDGVHGVLVVYYGDTISLPWSDYTARIRSWEGGINGDAAWKYLLGAEPDARWGRLAISAHLPNGWPEMTVENLRVGDTRLGLALRRIGASGFSLEATHWSGGALDLIVTLPAAFETPAASVNGAPAAPEVRGRPFGERVAEFAPMRLNAGERLTFALR